MTHHESHNGSTLLAAWREKVRALKFETLALYLAAQHPDTPWYAKALIGCVVAYALSPIDLIPDFIPVLGYLDDLILVPLGLRCALSLVPAAVLEECRCRAAKTFESERPVSRTAALVIISVWITATIVAGVVVWRLLQQSALTTSRALQRAL